MASDSTDGKYFVMSIFEKKNGTNCYSETVVRHLNEVNKDFFSTLEDGVNKIKGINEEIKSPSNTETTNPSESIVNETSAKLANDDVSSALNNVGAKIAEKRSTPSNTETTNSSESIVNETSNDLVNNVVSNAINNVGAKMAENRSIPSNTETDQLAINRSKDDKAGGKVVPPGRYRGGKSKHIKSYSHSRKHKKNKNKKMRRTSKIIP